MHALFETFIKEFLYAPNEYVKEHQVDFDSNIVHQCDYPVFQPNKNLMQLEVVFKSIPSECNQYRPVPLLIAGKGRQWCSGQVTHLVKQDSGFDHRSSSNSDETFLQRSRLRMTSPLVGLSI